MLMERIEKTLESNRGKHIELYRDLHRHPEVSGREKRTAGIIARHLRGLRLEVKTRIGGHGVVGTLKEAKPGPVQKIPGVMYWLGVSNEKKGILGLPHHPLFAVDQEAIIVGAKTMAAVLLNYLKTLK
jgi:metal-dependent amidase/aminoacylase/carboxypeptidase family protein